MANQKLIDAGFAAEDVSGDFVRYVNEGGIALVNADGFADIEDGDDVQGVDINSDAMIERMSFDEAIRIFGNRDQ